MLVNTNARGRLAAVCWLIGGALWVVHVALLHARPEGCIAEGCTVAGSSARPTEDLLWLFLLAVSALGSGILLAPTRRARGRTARRFAAGLVLAGVAALSLGLLVNAAIAGDSPLWWLHDSDSMGRLLPVLASGAAGVAALRGQWLHLGRWQGVLLILSALASFGFNAQTERIVFTVPLGLAWVAVGLAQLLRGVGRQGSDPAVGAGELDRDVDDPAMSESG